MCCGVAADNTRCDIHRVAPHEDIVKCGPNAGHSARRRFS